MAQLLLFSSASDSGMTDYQCRLRLQTGILWEDRIRLKISLFSVLAFVVRGFPKCPIRPNVRRSCFYCRSYLFRSLFRKEPGGSQRLWGFHLWPIKQLYQKTLLPVSCSKAPSKCDGLDTVARALHCRTPTIVLYLLDVLQS